MGIDPVGRESQPPERGGYKGARHRRPACRAEGLWAAQALGSCHGSGVSVVLRFGKSAMCQNDGPELPPGSTLRIAVFFRRGCRPSGGVYLPSAPHPCRLPLQASESPVGGVLAAVDPGLGLCQTASAGLGARSIRRVAEWRGIGSLNYTVTLQMVSLP